MFIKQETKWIALVPRLVLLAILCFLLYPYDNQIFFVYAFFLYLAITYSIKYSMIPGSTFTGVKFLKKGQFEEALPFIEKDIEYYSSKPWIDKYRFLLMISSSALSFREMSLCNRAWCLLQTGRVKETIDQYESVIRHYPQNVVTRAQLKTIKIVLQSVQGNHKN